MATTAAISLLDPDALGATRRLPPAGRLRRVGRIDVIEVEAKSILNRVAGMPFAWSVNPYRGCIHGCVFCYARRSHGYLEDDGVGRWSSRLYAKVNAAAVLRAELAKRTWRRETVSIGTVTDPYQPIESRYRLTRAILETLRDAETPVRIVTRSPLIVRDLDILRDLAQRAGAHVSVSIATMDAALAREIEPTVAPPLRRLQAVRALAGAGIDVSVALAPILPQITDAPEQIESVIAAAHEAGARHVWHGALHLHDVTRDAFFQFLRKTRPHLIARYAQLYRGKYAPRAVRDEIDARVTRARAALPKQRVAQIAPRGDAQLSLLL